MLDSAQACCPKELPSDVLESFDEAYRANVRRLPYVLQPDSVHHGKHSFTKSLGTDVLVASTCKLCSAMDYGAHVMTTKSAA